MCIGIVLGTLLGDIGDIISAVITSITAIIGAVAVYVQMKKDRELTQSEFLLEFSKYFYSFKEACELEDKIDDAIDNKKIYKYTTDDYEKLNDYLLWLESLCTMISNNTLSIELIDEIFNHRFFSVVNNPSIQEHELGRFAEYYKHIFMLHKEWVAYRKKLNLPVLYEEYDLSKLPNYNKIINNRGM